MKIVTSSRAANSTLKLTPAEMRLIRAYRQIDDERQCLYLGALEDCAKDETCRRLVKHLGLRLIAGGAT